MRKKFLIILSICITILIIIVIYNKNNNKVKDDVYRTKYIEIMKIQEKGSNTVVIDKINVTEKDMNIYKILTTSGEDTKTKDEIKIDFILHDIAKKSKMQLNEYRTNTITEIINNYETDNNLDYKIKEEIRKMLEVKYFAQEYEEKVTQEIITGEFKCEDEKIQSKANEYLNFKKEWEEKDQKK